MFEVVFMFGVVFCWCVEWSLTRSSVVLLYIHVTIDSLPSPSSYCDLHGSLGIKYFHCAIVYLYMIIYLSHPPHVTFTVDWAFSIKSVTRYPPFPTLCCSVSSFFCLFFYASFDSQEKNGSLCNDHCYASWPSVWLCWKLWCAIFLGHHWCGWFETIFGCSTGWAVSVHITFSDLGHMWRSQQCQTVFY